MKKRWIILGIIGLPILYVVLKLSYSFWNYDRVEPECVARDVILVDLNGTVLAVPRSYRPIIHAPKDAPPIEYANEISRTVVCQRIGERPIRVRRVIIMAEGNPFQSLKLYSNLNALDSISIFFRGFIYNNLAVKYRMGDRIMHAQQEQYKNKIIQKIKNWEQQAHNILQKGA